MLRTFFAISFTAMVIICLPVSAGQSRSSTHRDFRDMDHQPKYQPQPPQSTSFDGRAPGASQSRARFRWAYELQEHR